jgi:hypothetical protein
MSHLLNTRTLEAEHSYPEPNRNHLSMHNREAAKRRVGRKTTASEVRTGYRAKDGTTYMLPTKSEMHEARMQTLANKRLEQEARNKRISDMLGHTTAEVDTWAAKR